MENGSHSVQPRRYSASGAFAHLPTQCADERLDCTPPNICPCRFRKDRAQRRFLCFVHREATSNLSSNDSTFRYHLQRGRRTDAPHRRLASNRVTIESMPALSRQFEAALRIVEALRAEGHQAYLAGGCVRDLLLARDPVDYDVATSATPDFVLDMFPEPSQWARISA